MKNLHLRRFLHYESNRNCKENRWLGQSCNSKGNKTHTSKISKCPILISDNDHIITAAGISKKEVLERRISPTLEEYIEKRKSFYAGKGGENALMPVEGVEKSAAVMYPIISAGDVTGSVIMLFNEEKSMPTETENKLIQTAAAFLAKQTEDWTN